MAIKRIAFSCFVVVILFSQQIVSAETISLEQIRQKIQAAQTAGVSMVKSSDIKKELKNKKPKSQFGIALSNFGQIPLSVLRLKKGETVSELSAVVSKKSFRRVMSGNGLSPSKCEKLPVGFELYIPTAWLLPKLRLSPVEIGVLQESLASAKEAAADLTAEVGHLKEEIVIKDGQISELTGNLLAEQTAHAKTKEELLAEQTAHAKTKANLSAPASVVKAKLSAPGGLEFMNNPISWIAIAFLAIAATASLVFLKRGKGKKKPEQRRTADIAEPAVS